jgi:hypothetical protein
MLNIIDDFIKTHVQNEIEEILLGSNFPYFYCKESVDLGDSDTIIIDDNSTVVPQFFHMFITEQKVNSQYSNIILPISHKLIDIIDDNCFVHRCKVNLNTNDIRFKDRYHTPHIDNAFDNQITAIYYVNDSDGDTIFFDDKKNITDRVTPKKGRLVWWKGKIFHAKHSPIKSTQRVVINFNLLPIGDLT